MNRRIAFGTILILCLLSPIINGQISNPGTPPSWQYPVKAAILEKTITLPNTQKNKAIHNNSLSGKLKSLQIAQSVETNTDLLNQGTWTKLPDGRKICRIRFNCSEAKAMLCYFSVFEPAPNSQLYIYSADKKMLLGGYNANSCGVKGSLSVVPLPANSLIMEYLLPANSNTIGRIYLKAIDIDTQGTTLTPKDNEPNCYVNTVCAESAGWENEKNAVVRLTIKTNDGTLLCTGVLVNNTENANKFYVLTANHCVNTQDQATGTVVYFNYESASCSGSTPMFTHTISGTNLIASAFNLDFSLLELNTVPFQYQPFMAGWDIENQTKAGYAIIHHPEGWVKKITTSSNTVSISTYSGFQKDGFLKIYYSQGSTAEGSSGGPLFNSDHRLVGNLTGGYALCGNTEYDMFSRTAIAWNQNDDTSKQLKYWLDPALIDAKNITGRFAYNINKEGYSYFTNMKATEANKLQATSNKVFPSSSKNGYQGVAEQFTLTQTNQYIGFYIVPALVTHHSKSSVVKFELHQTGNQGDSVLFSKIVSLDSLTNNDPYFIEFNTIKVLSKTTTLQIKWDGIAANDTLAIAHSTFRQSENSAYAIQYNLLKSYPDIFGNEYNTSHAVWLKTTVKDGSITIKTSSKLKVSPNPSSGKFNLTLPDWVRPIELTIFNLNGKTVYYQNVTTANENIELSPSSLITGTYILRAKSKYNQSETKILIFK